MTHDEQMDTLVLWSKVDFVLVTTQGWIREIESSMLLRLLLVLDIALFKDESLIVHSHYSFVACLGYLDHREILLLYQFVHELLIRPQISGDLLVNQRRVIVKGIREIV